MRTSGRTRPPARPTRAAGAGSRCCGPGRRRRRRPPGTARGAGCRRASTSPMPASRSGRRCGRSTTVFVVDGSARATYGHHDQHDRGDGARSSRRIRRGTAETAAGRRRRSRRHGRRTRAHGGRRRARRLAECGHVEITGTAQHDAWQARALPPVEQLRADLWSIPVPIPHNPLRYVSVYAFALDGGGLGLLDTGWEQRRELGGPHRRAGRRSAAASRTCAASWSPTSTSTTSASPPGSGEASGAWIAMHPADATAVARLTADRAPRAMVASEVEFLVRLGRRSRRGGRRRRPRRAPGGASPAWPCPTGCSRTASTPTSPAGGCAPSTRRATHPATCASPRRRTRLFFSGDHVLPRISPNISTNHGGPADPLRDYLASLAAVRDLDPTEVLPAHEWRFRGLDDRVDSLTAHHESRLDRTARRDPRPIRTRRRGTWPPT